MVYKGNVGIDPRGLIYESYRMEGIGTAECRTIFLDWALGVPAETDMEANLGLLLQEYGTENADHPMTRVLQQGLAQHKTPKGRRGGAMGRRR